MTDTQTRQLEDDIQNAAKAMGVEADITGFRSAAGMMAGRQKAGKGQSGATVQPQGGKAGGKSAGGGDDAAASISSMLKNL
eukprot:420531-Prymnesium_polylepis.1